MIIKSIELNNFRNYANCTINFLDGVNFIVGRNAQGKTNLLESIYLMSVGKSPKNRKDKQLIRFDQERAKLDIKFLTNAGDKNIQMYLDKSDKKSIKINNMNILKLSELVGTLSVVYFSPDEMKLIKEVPEDRRNFLDISISQFDKAYLYDLMKYNRILKMRNQILKSLDSRESKLEQLKLFTPQLIDTSIRIIEKRLNFVEKLKFFAKNIHKNIIPNENLELFYSYQQKENISIRDDLNKAFEMVIDKELDLGYTCVGPHRDDIIFQINGQDCKFFASQGQQRTVALVLKLSLMEIINQEIGEYPILLLDDVLSELDSVRQENLLNMTTKYQTLISCTTIPNMNSSFNVVRIHAGQVEQ